MCNHQPQCPAPDAPDHEAARTVAMHPEQGWSLLCNGVVLFDDSGELLPNGRAIAPHTIVPRKIARRGIAPGTIAPRVTLHPLVAA